MRDVYLADKSAIARFAHPAVAEKLVHLGVNGALATCVLVDLEVLYSARTPKEYTQIADRRT
ncbi:MAG TPA: hypothetical protein VGR21_12695, partial [Cryptosporangiaceae bacterium]|nr:hypothetical protein [Cryptosporangiaceae bacterium]